MDKTVNNIIYEKTVTDRHKKTQVCNWAPNPYFQLRLRIGTLLLAVAMNNEFVRALYSN